MQRHACGSCSFVRPHRPNLTWISPATEHERQVLVLQVVLDVAHFVVHCDQVSHGDICALLYSLMIENNRKG